MFYAIEQYKNNAKKKRKKEKKLVNTGLGHSEVGGTLWESHMLGHSLPSGTIKRRTHQDQPQTSWLFEGIRHFHNGWRMMEIYVD